MAARRFELREVDDYTGGLIGQATFIARWDLEHPPAYLTSGPLDVGGGLSACVELRPTRTPDKAAS